MLLSACPNKASCAQVKIQELWPLAGSRSAVRSLIVISGHSRLHFNF